MTTGSITREVKSFDLLFSLPLGFIRKSLEIGVGGGLSPEGSYCRFRVRGISGDQGLVSL